MAAALTSKSEGKRKGEPRKFERPPEINPAKRPAPLPPDDEEPPF